LDQANENLIFSRFNWRESTRTAGKLARVALSRSLATSAGSLTAQRSKFGTADFPYQ